MWEVGGMLLYKTIAINCKLCSCIMIISNKNPIKNKNKDTICYKKFSKDS